MKQSFLLLCALFLMSACSSQPPPPPAEHPSDENAPSAEQSAPAADSQPSRSLPHITIEGSSEEASALFDGQKSGLFFQKGGTVHLKWDEPVEFDRICLQGLTYPASVAVYSGETPLYSQDSMGSDHWCYMGEQSVSELTVELHGENQTLSEILIEDGPENETSIFSAYLPISAFDPQMLQDRSFDRLEELIINTGCYWQEDGSLLYEEEFTNTLSSIHSAYPELELWCTINPQGKLIREGTAGRSIASSEQRSSLIENILAFCLENHLSGVDIDWEFPQESEWKDFSALLLELSDALEKESISLSAAFYPNKIKLSKEAIQSLPCVRVMAYDQFDELGYHSTYRTAEDAIRFFESLGFSSSQLSLGIPAYGRPTDASAQWPFYSQAAAQLFESGNLLNGVFYNGPQLVQDKTVFSQQEGLYGVFLYHLGCDLPSGQNDSLVNSIREITNR